MFKFEQPSALYFLVLIPLIWLIFYLLILWKKKRISQIGDVEIVHRLFPNYSLKKEYLKMGLFSFATLFAILAYANPQWGMRQQKVKAKSSDIIIALDISQSMMAEDISPNRMENAKRFTAQLIKSLKGERIGLIYFAGSAYLQMPLTNDYAAAELFIKSANPRQAGTQGTAVAEAIDLAQNLFANDSPYQKALVLITDGENHESEAIDAAELASKDGTFIFTIGVGTQDGALIPFEENGRKVYKKDKSGNPVKTKLNIALLQDIADAANGEFYLLDDGFSLVRKIVNDLAKVEKKEVEQRSFTDYNSFFQHLLFLAFVLLVVEYLISNKKTISLNIKKLLNI